MLTLSADNIVKISKAGAKESYLDFIAQKC
jgi:hypothetical protein